MTVGRWWMRSGRPGRGVLATVLLVAPAVAQVDRAAVLTAKLAELPHGSLAWFEAAFDLVEAQWDTDVRLARATAAGFVDVAAASDVPGAAATAFAQLSRVVLMGEGPVAAREWDRKAGPLPDGTAATLRVVYNIAKARIACGLGNHSEEVVFAAQARSAAKDIDDARYRLRAMSIDNHVRPGRFLVALKRFFAEARSAGQMADIEPMRHFLLFEERRVAAARGEAAAVMRAEAAIENHLLRHDSPRVRGDLLVHRGNAAFDAGRFDDANACFRAMGELMERVGDRRALAASHRSLAYVALARGDLGVAEEWLDEVERLIEHRGFRSEERDLLGMRWDLAQRRGEEALAETLRQQCVALDAESDRVAQQLTEESERVRDMEVEKEEVEARLVAEQARAQQDALRARTIGGIGVVVALSLVAAVSWRSRRRLLVANARLAEQIRAVEQGRIAQEQLEERMRQLERTESLGTMAAGVAHDFNNLLTSILGNAELLAQTASGEGVELARTIHLAGEQASRLCRQLQSYAGGSPTKAEPLDLTAVARTALPALHAAVREQTEVELCVGSTPVPVVADRAQIEQVLLNLVVNARDARATHVRIEIGLRPDEQTVGGTVAVLAVADDGDGMTAEVQRRIFDPFFTTRFPGRGLGLAVVHGVVRRHAGRVHVQSAPGNGSRFEIELPSAGGEPTVTIPAPPVEPGHLPPDFAVVAVDDDAAVRMLLARLFDRLSVHAMVADHGIAALDAVAGIVPSRHVVAFVDLTMPDMDGVEVVRRLRRLRPDVCVVVMSGHPPAYVERVARELDADHVLAKPFSLESVRAVLLALTKTAVARQEPGV